MKKIFLVFILLFTGCGFKNVDVFSTTCKSSINTMHFDYTEEGVITYKNNEISSIDTLYTYKGLDDNAIYSISSAKMSLDSNFNLYKNIEGFSTSIITDEKLEYSIKTTFDLTNMSRDNMDKLGVTNDYLKQLKTYKQVMECKEQ